MPRRAFFTADAQLCSLEKALFMKNVSTWQSQTKYSCLSLPSKSVGPWQADIRERTSKKGSLLQVTGDCMTICRKWKCCSQKCLLGQFIIFYLLHVVYLGPQCGPKWLTTVFSSPFYHHDNPARKMRLHMCDCPQGRQASDTLLSHCPICNFKKKYAGAIESKAEFCKGFWSLF